MIEGVRRAVLAGKPPGGPAANIVTYRVIGPKYKGQSRPNYVEQTQLYGLCSPGDSRFGDTKIMENALETLVSVKILFLELTYQKIII